MITRFSEFINENFSFPDKITIEEFVDKLRLPMEEKDVIIEWWNKNRKRFNILYFKFNPRINSIINIIIITDFII